jgi:hypothetical protein
MREMPGVHIDQNRCSHKSECALARNVNAGDSEVGSYLLHCAKGAELINPTLQTISALGLVMGEAASHPSFTWSIDTLNRLIATPIDLTEPNKTWYFWLEANGELEFL